MIHKLTLALTFVLLLTTPMLAQAVAIDFGDSASLSTRSVQLLVIMTHPFDNVLLAAGRSRSLLMVQLVVLVGGIPLIA